MSCEVKPQLQSGGERQDDGSPILAHMGELEPSIFVVPVPFVIELTLDFEALSIEVEYFQEDFDGEFGNRYVTSRGQIMITGTAMSFGGKIRYKHMSSC